VFNNRKRTVIVNRLKVFSVHIIAAYFVIIIELIGHVAHHILNKFWVVVGLFGDEFFVGAFQYRKKFGAGLRFNAFD